MKKQSILIGAITSIIGGWFALTGNDRLLIILGTAAATIGIILIGLALRSKSV